MLLLDENITKDQKELLEKWGYHPKQIGVDLKYKGIADENIITFLRSSKNILFVTRDSDFYKNQLCHPAFCIVFLEVDRSECAFFVRKFLSHKKFKSNKQRVGKVIKLTQTIISYWEVNSKELMVIKWMNLI